jgi:hypothetical protein
MTTHPLATELPEVTEFLKVKELVTAMKQWSRECTGWSRVLTASSFLYILAVLLNGPTSSSEIRNI